MNFTHKIDMFTGRLALGLGPGRVLDLVGHRPRPVSHPIGLYRENAIAVRVIDRSAYDATSRVHAHRQRKNLSYLRNGCCIYYLRPSSAAHL